MPAYSASRIADHFTDYLFHGYTGDKRHVQRIASWLGLLILGLEKLGVAWRPSRERQLIFEISGKRYKARYNHAIKPRGGIEFVEVAKARGAPDIAVRVTISSLDDAARFYDAPHL